MVFTPQKPPRHPTEPSSPANPTTAKSPSNADWSPALQTVLDQPSSKLPSRFAIGGMIFLTAFTIWACVGQVDEVARAGGKLEPKGTVFKVHPVTAGKIAHLNVREGDSVKQKQTIAELDTELDRKEVERLDRQLLAAQMEFTQTQSMMQQLRYQAQTRRAIAQTEIEAQLAKITENRTTTENSQALLNQLQADADAQTARLARLKPLSDEGVIPRERLFEIEQEIRSRQRSITEQQGTMRRAAAELNQLNVGLKTKQASAQQTYNESKQAMQELQLKLTQLQSKVSETQLLLKTAKTRVRQQILSAPVDGSILSLTVQRPGTFITPDQPIAEISPKGAPLILVASLPSQEAGFVKVGMPVKIKFDAYPYQDYGIIDGTVLTVSPDSKSDPKLGQIYRIEIQLKRPIIRARGQLILLKAGQTASAEIVVRRRRIVDVLLDPIKKMNGDASL